MPQLSSIAVVGLIFIVMYVFMIRPQQQKDKKIQEMRDSLRVGDEIITIGGIYGKIVKIKDDTFTLLVGSDKTKIVVTKWAISGPAEDVERDKSDKKSKSDKDSKNSEDKVNPKNIKKLGQKTEAPEEDAEEEA